MRAIVDQVADVDNLRQAWNRIRSEREPDEEAPRRADLEEFELFLDDRLHILRDALRTGAWEPSPLRRVDILKPPHGTRRLRIPVVEDRVVERAIAQVLGRFVDAIMGPWSFAYRPGRGVHDALLGLAELRDEGYGHVARVDIEDCFDTIDRASMLRSLRAQIDDEWLLDLVARLMARPERIGEHLRDRPAGLPQGSPLSPLLANLVLTEFDEAVAAAGFPVVRYADDAVVLATDADDAHEGLEVARRVLGHLGLRVKEEKVTITSFEEGFAYLGEDIGPVYPSSTRPVEVPGKRTVYVTAQGAGTFLRDGQLRVRVDGHDVLTVPVALVGRLVLVGSVGLSAGLRSHALYHEIDVAFLSRRGGWLGRLDSTHRLVAGLRRAQYAAVEDPTFCIDLARWFVAGKLANMRALLMRYCRRSSSPQLVGAAEALAQARTSCLRADRIEQIQGTEGAATKGYFAAFATLLPDGMEFDGRSRRPPRDPVNSALSFGYSLLVGEVVAAVQTAGLDPAVGMLHADERGRPSLALDLMEEFRPVLVDTVVVDLFRRGALTNDHFRVDADNGGVFLADDGRARFLAAFEERMLTRFRHPAGDTRITYRQAITRQATLLAQIVVGSRHEYAPVIWR